MRPKVLLVNPWIYDFAAANLWSAPFGLYRVAEYLSRFELDLSLLDCMAPPGRRRKYPKEIVEKPVCLQEIPRRFGRYGISVREFRERLADLAPFDFVFMTCVMSYWYPGAQLAISLIRELCGGVPVVLGGIYATLWHEHASSHSGADFIYKGELSEDMKFVFDTFGFRVKRRKSPGSPYYKMGLGAFNFAPVATSAGCPFECSYCGSRLLRGGFSQLPPTEVSRQIQELYSFGFRDFAFYDDALLVDAESHIEVILKEVIGRGLQARFHCPNGLHARFIDRGLSELMRRAGFKTLRLGLETADQRRQLSTGGKINSSEIESAVKVLRGAGFMKREVGIYLMYGLPGQDLGEVVEGIRFVKSLAAGINLAEFSPIPGTKSWNELLDKGTIRHDIDPLLTNNTVFSYLFSGYDREELRRIKLDVKQYNSEGRE